MSVFDWSPDPAQNMAADTQVAARDGASARELPGMIRGVMAGVAALTGDQGGALVSTGAGDVYEVQTVSGLRPAPGVTLAFWADRTNVAEPALAVDGYGPAPLRAADGGELAPGAVRRGEFQLVAWDEAVSAAQPGWRKVNPSPTDLQVINAATVLAALRLILPSSPPPGKGNLWLNDGTFVITTED